MAVGWAGLALDRRRASLNEGEESGVAAVTTRYARPCIGQHRGITWERLEREFQRDLPLPRLTTLASHRLRRSFPHGPRAACNWCLPP